MGGRVGADGKGSHCMLRFRIDAQRGRRSFRHDCKAGADSDSQPPARFFFRSDVGINASNMKKVSRTSIVPKRANSKRGAETSMAIDETTAGS